MGQTESMDTDNLSAQAADNDISLLQRLVENKGAKAMVEYINGKLNRWKQEKVKLAVSGRAATGKSMFINSIRNLKPGDDGFAMTGSGDTTTRPTLYMHPKNVKITFYDLPGYSSTTFRKADYILQMNIVDYDFVFIFFNNVVSEDEIWLVSELIKMGKPFSLVRSKIDIDIDNAIHDGKDQQMIIPEIKRKNEIALQANPELNDTKAIFLISCRNHRLGEWSELMTHVEETIEGIKAETFLFSLDSTTKEIMERKHAMLKRRLILTTALAAGIAVIPITALHIAVNIKLVENELRHYMSVFGVEQERINSLKDFDKSLLKCRYLSMPNDDIAGFLATQIGNYKESRNDEYVSVKMIPIVGSVISSVKNGKATYKLLSNMLQDIKLDAVLIYEHIIKDNANYQI